MVLTAGSRLGVYEVVAPLGAGGMGEVYRARDTKLGRSVAVKVLPEVFAFDAERVARFEREAKVLASLNHPHIAALHGMEVADGRHVLIMELVEGETLAERLQRGALPVKEVLQIAIQIAEALEAAHEAGIVHRDLKPANIKLTPDDQVKVLDFGLARAMEAAPAAAGNVSQSPTLSMMATQAGVILGTAAYMSPEQAKGLPADHRSDVFSFGCVLYELLTGLRAFQGATAPDILASVLVRDPDLTALPPNLHPRIVELLRRCLQKNPKKRWQAMGDLRADLEAIDATPDTPSFPAVEPAARPRPWTSVAALATVATAAALVTGAVMVYVRPPDVTGPVTRFTIALPEGQQFTSISYQTFAISPDGSRLAVIADKSLYLRSMSALGFEPVQGAGGGPGILGIAFSPDGQSLAYWSTADSTLKRIPVTGGTPVTIAKVDPPNGLTWDASGLLFGSNQGVMRLSPNGGTPERLIGLAQNEVAQSPQILPGGDTILFTVATGTASDRWDKARIVVQTVGSDDRRTLLEGADARYLPSGHIVYAVGTTLFGVPFDVSRREVRGAPTPIVEGVRRGAALTGIAQFAVSPTGWLAYLRGPSAAFAGQFDLALSDRRGNVEPLGLSPGAYDAPRVSPDGKLIAVGVDGGAARDVWIHDLSRANAPRRLTFGGNNRFPVWSADGRRLAFQSDRDGVQAIYAQTVDGSATAVRITEPEKGTAHVPESWSRDDLLLFSIERDGRRSLWTWSLRDRDAHSFGRVESVHPIAATFSPDGRWVAYATSDQSNHVVYVQPFPATGAMSQISRGDDGHHPVWSRDGMELFFIPGPGSFAAVGVQTAPAFSFTAPVAIAPGINTTTPIDGRDFDVTPDGRFVGLITPSGGYSSALSIRQVEVVLNWLEELKARVPVP